MSEKESLVEVFGGVDTHRDCHVAAAVDTAGRVLGTAPFPADATGFEELGGWLRSQGRVVRVGVEGTGSYGAGLTRYLTGIGIEVVEVNRANRQLRRRLGKTDTTDAQAAGRAALNGQATARPKTADGLVEGIRMLRVVRCSAIKARTQAINQLHALVVTAPEQVKHQLRGLSTKARIRACAGLWSRHSRYHHHGRQENTALSGAPLPGAHHRDQRTRQRDHSSLFPGQPGAALRPGCRS